MEPEPQSPPVVAVVVCSNPGPWFDEALAAVAGLDYPNLSVLIIDAGSDEDPTPRVAAVAPSAFVRRVANRGFAASANEVLGVVEGASHYLFCHDDVAPDPDALGLLLEEAFRSNAGVVAPKLVDWDDPQLLLQVGMGVDKSGAPAPIVERGELDQEQHDAVRDVFVAPGGCTLVRADLFAALGGFDGAMFLFGEDLDLSWRAQIAGARVVVAPSARVRHLEALSSGRRVAGGDPRRALDDLRSDVRPLQLRHRLRAVLSAYGPFHLVRVLPQLVLLATVEALFGLLTGHAATSRDIIGAWRWNLSRTSEVRVRRKQVHTFRQLPDSEVRRLQTRGSARMNAFLRGQLAPDRRLRMRAVHLGSIEERGPALRMPAAVVAIVALVLFVGSRHLLGGSQSAVGELSPFPSGPWSGLLRPFLNGWRTTGLGAEAPAPAAFALLGLAGTVLLGHMALLQQVLVLGTVPFGAIGAYRLMRPLGSPRVRLAAAVVYLAIPLPYNAIARGHWSGLLAYGAAPWVVSRLLRAARVAPYDDDAPRPFLHEAAPLAVILAVLGALAPVVPFAFILAAVGLALGGVVTGVATRLLRGVSTVVVATALAALLLFPWTLDFVLPGASLSAITGPLRPESVALGLGAIVRFHTGPIGSAPVGWALLIAAALPLVIGGADRLAWAGRLWIMSISCWLVTWAGGRGWLHLPAPTSDALLAPAALGLAMCVALGLAAFEVDLSAYRFGWRQVASVVAAAAVVVGAVPVIIGAAGGRWHQPGNDFNRVLSWMPERRVDGDFRVLWIGDPDALPLGSWSLGGGLGYATSRNGPPSIVDRWPDAAAGPSKLLADDVRAAQRGRTTQLGHLLAPLAVRYIVLPQSQAPHKERAPSTPLPVSLTRSLGAQIDLKQLESDEALLVYENAEWMPGRAVLDGPADEASRHSDPRSLAASELAGATPALRSINAPTSARGRLPDAAPLFLSESASDRWLLKVEGADVPRRRAFGWANAFDVERGGRASLTFRTSPLRYAAIAIELILWAVAVRCVFSWRRPRGDHAVAARRSEVAT